MYKAQMTKQEPLFSVDALFEQVLQYVQEVESSVREYKANGLDFERVKQMLAALPLDTVAFGLSNQRLSNAAKYVTSREWGAANFEMRQLLNSLRRAHR